MHDPCKGIPPAVTPPKARSIDFQEETQGTAPAFGFEEGIFFPPRRPVHASDLYDERGCEVLFRIQGDHFWYRGRHRLLLSVFRTVSRFHFGKDQKLRAIDLGGGCGGWLAYLAHHAAGRFSELALADSSLVALRNAAPVIGSFADRYCVDLSDLPWEGYWDVAFLLDVLEHIPDQEAVLGEIGKALKPGGLLFITAPALRFFWTHNDVWVHHQRRYSRDDFRPLALRSGFRLLRSDYFMFFLSPFLMIQRVLGTLRPPQTPDAIRATLEKSHRVPPSWINAAMGYVFSMEVALFDAVSFPWGTSILAILKRRSTPTYRRGCFPG